MSLSTQDVIPRNCSDVRMSSDIFQTLNRSQENLRSKQQFVRFGTAPRKAYSPATERDPLTPPLSGKSR